MGKGTTNREKIPLWYGWLGYTTQSVSNQRRFVLMQVKILKSWEEILELPIHSATRRV